MTDKQYSAEKDLLKLIENPGEADLRKTEAPPDAARPAKKKSFFSFGGREKKTETKKKLSFWARLTDRKNVLRGLLVLTFCALAFFVVTVMSEYSKMKKTSNLVKFTYISQGKETRLAGTAVEPPAEPTLESDLGGELRNIFKPGAVKKEEAKKDEAAIVLSDFRLVGISIAPDAKDTYAMVKNAKTNITFFLKKGESLDGMELLNIFDNKLSFKVKGKEVELR